LTLSGVILVSDTKTNLRFNALLVTVLLGFAAAVSSVNAAEPETAAEPSEEISQSGFDEMTSLAGPDGVTEQLIQGDRVKRSIFEWGEWADPWFDWKAKVKEENGLALGFFVSVLGQKASDSTTDDDNALGGIYRFNGSWTRQNSGKNLGRFEWRVEARSRIGNNQSPQTLGSAIGADVLNSGFAYSDRFKTDLAVLSWAQTFRDSTAGFAAGRLAFDVYLDAMPFQSFSRGFLNRSFLLNPTIATTGIGALGAAGRMFVSKQVWLGAQVYDGNAVSGEFDWDTIQESEYLKAVEVGWTPSIDVFKTTKVQFTYWDKDERKLAGVADGSGWAVSASWQVNERFLPFVRFGDSDGGAGVAAETALSGGFEYKLKPDQAWTLGIGWAEPSEKTNGAKLDDEYVIETSLNLQLGKNFSLLPDLQLVIDPANNPDKSRVWVGGLRAILTF